MGGYRTGWPGGPSPALHAATPSPRARHDVPVLAIDQIPMSFVVDGAV